MLPLKGKLFVPLRRQPYVNLPLRLLITASRGVHQRFVSDGRDTVVTDRETAYAIPIFVISRLAFPRDDELIDRRI